LFFVRDVDILLFFIGGLIVLTWCFPHYQQALLRALATVLIGDSTE
jgi:dolichol kinase